jgi:hypothetical protein
MNEEQQTSPEVDRGEGCTETPRSIRPVIEHALTDYGFSLDTARTLIDQRLAEGGGR